MMEVKCPGCGHEAEMCDISYAYTCINSECPHVDEVVQ